jgi:PTS system galactitol-specific IIC component
MFIVDYIVGLGASVMMPLIFMLLGLLLRLSLSKALKAGLMVGIGFIGLSITVNLMIDSLTPVSHALVERFGLNLNVLDGLARGSGGGDGDARRSAGDSGVRGD